MFPILFKLYHTDLNNNPLLSLWIPAWSTSQSTLIVNPRCLRIQIIPSHDPSPHCLNAHNPYMLITILNLRPKREPKSMEASLLDLLNSTCMRFFIQWCLCNTFKWMWHALLVMHPLYSEYKCWVIFILENLFSSEINPIIILHMYQVIISFLTWGRVLDRRWPSCVIHIFSWKNDYLVCKKF